MSSGGSTGMPATPAPTPFTHGPGGVRPEDLAAGISRLSVIQEAADTAPQVAINVLEATDNSGNASSLSNYFGSPQSSGESIFDQLTTPAGSGRERSRSNSNSGSGFHDVTINTPSRRHQELAVGSSLLVTSTPQGLGRGQPFSGGTSPQQFGMSVPNSLATSPVPPAPAAPTTPGDLLSPASTISNYATPAAPTPVVETAASFPSPTLDTPVAQPLPKPVSTLSAPQPPIRPESPVLNKLATTSQADAWIPTPACKEVLDSMANTPGTYYPSRDQLTCPGVTPGSEQGDPVRDLVAKYQGESEACKRRILAADGVTTDTRGLQQLIAAGNYRAAINLTAHLLEMYGQGKGRAGQLSKHSQTSLQIWFTRLALLVKLKLYNIAETEAEQFAGLEKPDVFCQYYSELYGGRRGSLAPWSMRLLIAQIPGLSGKHIQSFNKLFSLLFSVRTMIKNLENGLAADGSVWLEAGEEERRDAAECWRERERQVLYSLINNSIASSDFESGIKCLDLLVPVERPERLAALHAAYGRLYLQLGHITRADQCFAQASRLRNSEDPQDQLEGLMDSAFLAIGQYLVK